jgi:hypothetical protein
VQFAGSYAGEALTYASHYDSNGQVESMDVFLAPSMTPVDYPDDLPDPTSPDRHPAIPFPAATGDLFWLLYLNGRTQLFDQQGQSVAASPSLGSLLPGAWWLGSSQVGADVQVWQSDAAGSPNSSRTLYVEVDDTGRPLAGFTTDLRSLRFRARLDETRWLGSAQIPPAPGEPDRGENYRAVLIDTVSGTVHPILGLPRDASPLPGNFSWPRLAVTGDFVRVATGDADCLNVREEATTAATSLGCFADGVLLRVLDAEPVAGWVPVTTPGGAAGFVAEAFVER